jgi:hypothetical protein
VPDKEREANVQLAVHKGMRYSLGFATAGLGLQVAKIDTATKDVITMPSGKKRKRLKIATHKRKKKRRANRHKKRK